MKSCGRFVGRIEEPGGDRDSIRWPTESTHLPLRLPDWTIKWRAELDLGPPPASCTYVADGQHGLHAGPPNNWSGGLPRLYCLLMDPVPVMGLPCLASMREDVPSPAMMWEVPRWLVAMWYLPLLRVEREAEWREGPCEVGTEEKGALNRLQSD